MTLKHRDKGWWNIYDNNGNFSFLSNNMVKAVKESKIKHPDGFTIQRTEENGKQVKIYTYVPGKSSWAWSGRPESYKWIRYKTIEMIE